MSLLCNSAHHFFTVCLNSSHYCRRVAVSTVSRQFSVGKIIPSSVAQNITPQSNKEHTIGDDEGEFPVLDIMRKGPGRIERRPPRIWEAALPPRYTRMPIDQDWGNVWPTARTYHPGTVPLPIRMGFRRKRHPQPDRFANLELMKIPNFLHLTPPVIKRQCEAIKKFCTDWPEGLETEEEMRKHFPLKVESSNYVYSSPSIREPRSRIITLSFSLASLKLTKRSKDKFLRLLGPERYDRDTDTVTIVIERCPIRQQNYDYGVYLMVVLYVEACKREPWETEKTRDDHEEYIWEDSPSQHFLFETFRRSPPDSLPVLNSLGTPETIEQMKAIPEVQEYGKAVEALHNEGETESTLEAYKASVLRLLNFTPWLEAR